MVLLTDKKMKNKLVQIGQVAFMALGIYFYVGDPFNIKWEYNLILTMLISSVLGFIGDLIIYKKIDFNNRGEYYQVVKMCYFILLCILYLLFSFRTFCLNGC